ncbi:hypothetical protein HYH03_005653 [Edaphochlamys debaryana]|uniref:Uncharacterized protein n=1 Tax=Edaphochlamys debaryana TaxID=47281 RepID=A0A835YF24_9CHLO|nr:hypothetical protein HYH03_005653 [Edaphochlamys debaryana]|eukprot:KAG2496429.1 hypothetical protein HYH03_005653 [Edaphochlamys debaryana]
MLLCGTRATLGIRVLDGGRASEVELMTESRQGRHLLQEASSLPPTYGSDPSPSVPLPPSTFPPSPTPSPSQPTSPAPPTTAPTCALGEPFRCLTINATSGSPLDAFVLTATEFRAASADYPDVVFEFGVLEDAGNWVRQAYSLHPSTVISGLKAGFVRLYACARAAAVPTGEPIGPRTCAHLVVNITAQAEQASALLSKATEALLAGPINSTARMVEVAQTLSTALSLDPEAAGTVTARVLASNLLTQLVGSAPAANASSSATLAVLTGVAALWSVVTPASRTDSLASVTTLSESLATQQLAAEDCAAVVTLYSAMVDGAKADVLAAANGTANATAAAETARDVLAAVTRGAAALTRGLLNGATADGAPVTLATATLSALVQRATAALASAGVNATLSQPGAQSGYRRHLLSAPSPVTVALNTSAGALCAADAFCAQYGLGLTLTILADSSLLLASMGGSAAALAVRLPGYQAGMQVSLVSPIVRIAAPGLPAAAVGTLGLVAFAIPVNASALVPSALRAVVRLQDFAVAAVDPSAGITAAASTTRTLPAAASAAADVVSGDSSAMGDFVVLQYGSGTAVPNSGNSTDNNGAATTRVPSSLLTSTLAGIVTLALAVLAA